MEHYGAGALTLVLAGLTNGVGQRLGDAVEAEAGAPARGARAVRGFLAQALLWGWPQQEQGHPSAGEAGAPPPPVVALRRRAAAAMAAAGAAESAEGLPALALLSPGLCDAWAPEWASGSRVVPFLHAARESGLATALRRLRLMAPVAAAKAELASASGGAGVSAGAAASVEMVSEALALLERVARLRGAFAAAAAAGGRAGFFVPLACGHNVAWGPAEQALLSAALDEAAPAM